MEHEQEPKWEGKAIIKLKGPSADQIWALLSDFFTLNKWLPGIETCSRVQGVSGEAGCIRYLAGTAIPSPDGDSVTWANEKLLSIDPIGMTYTYEMLENNMGFGSYVATMKVVSKSHEGCEIDWSFVMDPMKGWSKDVFVSYSEIKMQAMAKRMEDAIHAEYLKSSLSFFLSLSLSLSMEQEQEPKWEGKAITKLKGPSADQIWALISDFFSLNKWLPGIDTCNRVEGVSGEPGCIRYCAGSSIPSPDGDSITWANEKLLSIDPSGKTFTYEIMDNNIGFGSYVATMKVVSDSDDGCEIEWSFVMDPVKNWSQEVFIYYLDMNLKTMGKRMEEAIQAGP
ncbi:uncharacterized protein LOC143891923 [Tasmannia lanceolata]|uniref:uncharacterized protein LOC143891923 n=1 Tax=Tasmannia lanceolata TaxID=3420 RepID=UPI004063E78A